MRTINKNAKSIREEGYSFVLNQCLKVGTHIFSLGTHAENFKIFEQVITDEMKVDDCGYLCVVLCKDGEKPKQKFIHRLVAEAFLPTNDYTLQVNHKDSNRKNNKIDNLEWCSAQYKNMLAHAKRVEQYDLYGNKLAEYASIVVASNITGVSASSISHCCRKDTKTSGGFIWKYTEE